jgi:hypothetical protein
VESLSITVEAEIMVGLVSPFNGKHKNRRVIEKSTCDAGRLGRACSRAKMKQQLIFFFCAGFRYSSFFHL